MRMSEKEARDGGVGPGLCGAVLMLLTIAVLGTTQLSAQSASHTMLATATVAAEESYVARDAVQDLLRDQPLRLTGTKRYRGVSIFERWMPSATEPAKPARIVTVFFPGT